jgi:hypothetical protein
MSDNVRLAMRWLGLTLLVAACGAETDPPACDPDACAAEGKLCEADACVDPWRFGSPVWSRCEGGRTTAESLAAKAAGYDARALGLHAHPQMPWVMDVTIAPGVDPEVATYRDVVQWRSSENDGLWNGLVIAAEAYRFAVTHDPAARATLGALLDGEATRMRITGVPGLFTRQLIPPGVPGIACPTELDRYVPNAEKRGNRYVMIGSDGCAQISDGVQFISTTHCGLAEFAGWCFLDNISQDEYIGHVFGLGAVARVVDDAELRGKAVDMLRQVGEHLAQHAMTFIDWDGRPTQWGKLYPGAPGDTPGYLAILGMSMAATAAVGTGDADLAASYAALDWGSYFDQIEQWTGDDGCQANWNNLSMLTASFHHLLWNERDPARRAPLLAAFDVELAHPTVSARGILAEHNAWYDIMWAAQKPLGSGTDGPAYAAVEDAVCQLRQFPRSNHVVARDTTPLAPEVCLGRQSESLAGVAFEIADRCAATYAWWGNPYQRSACADEPTAVQQPAGFLLPYWMARYYGFIDAAQ